MYVAEEQPLGCFLYQFAAVKRAFSGEQPGKAFLQQIDASKEIGILIQISFAIQRQLNGRRKGCS